MAIQLFTSTIVAIVEGTWTTASVLVKYFLIAEAIRLYYNDNLNLKSFQEEIMSMSRPFVVALIVVGALVAASGVTFTPLIKLFSELVALAYFGYLFWKF